MNSKAVNFTFFTKNKELNFVILLPIINALATILTGFFSSDQLNPGNIRALIIGLYSIYFIFNKFPNVFVTKLYLVFLIYTFVLIFLSSDPLKSSFVYFKMYVSGTLFFIGYYFAKYDGFLKRISISIIVSLFIFIINFIISDFLGIGQSSYKGMENEFHFGQSGINLAKGIAAILLMAPVLLDQLESKKSKYISSILLVLGVLFLLIAFKRSAILSLVLGYSAYLIITKNMKSVKITFVFLLVLALLSPLYMHIVTDNYKARESAIRLDEEGNLEEQGRYLEMYRVIDAFTDGDIIHKMIGSELFNDAYFFKTRRMLHTDYMTLLNGSGMIGLTLYLLTYISIFYALKRNSRLYRNILVRKYFGVGVALLIAMLFFGIAGAIQSIEPRGTILFFIGALISQPKRLFFQSNMVTNTIIKPN